MWAFLCLALLFSRFDKPKKGRLTRPFFLPTQVFIRAYSLLCAPSQKGWLAVILQPQKYTVLFSVAVNAAGENGLP